MKNFNLIFDSGETETVKAENLQSAENDHLNKSYFSRHQAGRYHKVIEIAEININTQNTEMMREETFTLNIGLENNPFNAGEVEAIISTRLGCMTTINTRLHIGEWNGNEERTLIVSFTSAHRISFIIALVEELCTLLTQEAIPAAGENFGILIYNNNFTDERFTFNPEYFINF